MLQRECTLLGMMRHCGHRQVQGEGRWEGVKAVACGGQHGLRAEPDRCQPHSIPGRIPGIHPGRGRALHVGLRRQRRNSPQTDEAHICEAPDLLLHMGFLKKGKLCLSHLGHFLVSDWLSYRHLRAKYTELVAEALVCVNFYPAKLHQDCQHMTNSRHFGNF